MRKGYLSINREFEQEKVKEKNRDVTVYERSIVFGKKFDLYLFSEEIRRRRRRRNGKSRFLE